MTNQVDIEAILAKRAARHEDDNKRRAQYLARQGVLAGQREAWVAACNTVRDKVARGEAPSPEEMTAALANPDRPPVDAQKVIDIANAKRRIRQAQINGQVPDPVDVMIVMDED
jgi:hypothetical protein